MSTSIDVVMADAVDPTPTAQESNGPPQVQVLKLDKREYAELLKLTTGAPSLAVRMSAVGKIMQAEKAGVVQAESEDDEGHYYPPVASPEKKDPKPLPDWAEPVYNPNYTTTDYECQQAGLDTGPVGAGDHMCDPIKAGRVITPAVTCSACAELRVWPCQYECDGCEKTGARVATLAQLHDCIRAKECDAVADVQIAALGKSLKTADGMQQRVRASVCCNNMNCKLASAVESKTDRAAANESNNQAANQSRGNIRYRSADDFEDCMLLIRDLKVKGLIDADTAYSMVLDTATWTYWTKTRQVKAITVGKAFVDMHEGMGLTYTTSTLQDMLDDFARLPLNFITTVIVDHINDERTTDTYGQRKDRPWKSIFDDLLKRAYPDPYTSLHCWIRMQAWIQNGCRQCPETGALLHTVNFRAMRPDGRNLFLGAESFHSAMFPHMQRVAASEEKLPMRCSERGFEYGKDQNGFIGNQISAACKGTKTVGFDKRYTERCQISQLMKLLEGNHAELVSTQVHQAKTGHEYMPACNSLDAANNCHVARRVSNFGRSMGWDETYKGYARNNLTFTACAKDVNDCGSLITLFLKDHRCPVKKQKGMEIVPSEPALDNSMMRNLYPRDRIRNDVLKRGLPTDVDTEEKFMPRTKRVRNSASALFNEQFVPVRDVVSGMGLLVANPAPADLSAADRQLDEMIALRAIERMQMYHADISKCIKDFTTALVPRDMVDQVNVWKDAEELTEQMVRRTPEVVHALDLAAQDLINYADGKSKFCPTELAGLVDGLKGFHDAVMRYREPLPQPVLSRAFRRVPVYVTGSALNAPSLQLKSKEDGHCFKNYQRLVDAGMIDAATYDFDKYRTLDAEHATLRGHIHRNSYKKRWYTDLVASVLPGNVGTKWIDRTRMPIGMVDTTGNAIETLDLHCLVGEVVENDDADTQDVRLLKEWLKNNKWSATVSETPPEPRLHFEEWLTGHQIDSAYHFPDNADLRRQHAMHLLREHQQALSVTTGKEITAAKMASKDRDKKNKDAHKRWTERKMELDLDIKRSIGRWLYQDQQNEDGGLKYQEDESMLKYESDYVRDMQKRFTGTAAHTRERQRKLRLGLEHSIYDATTRHAADLALYKQGQQMVAKQADKRKGATSYEESLTDEGRQELANLLCTDNVASDNDDDKDDTSSTNDAGTLNDPIEKSEVSELSAKEIDLANGTICTFSSDEDYTELAGVELARARKAWEANRANTSSYPGPVVARDAASASKPAKAAKPAKPAKSTKKRARGEACLANQHENDNNDVATDKVDIFDD